MSVCCFALVPGVIGDGSVIHPAAIKPHNNNHTCGKSWLSSGKSCTYLDHLIERMEGLPHSTSEFKISINRLKSFVKDENDLVFDGGSHDDAVKELETKFDEVHSMCDESVDQCELGISALTRTLIKMTPENSGHLRTNGSRNRRMMKNVVDQINGFEGIHESERSNDTYGEICYQYYAAIGHQMTGLAIQGEENKAMKKLCYTMAYLDSRNDPRWKDNIATLRSIVDSGTNPAGLTEPNAKEALQCARSGLGDELDDTISLILDPFFGG